MIDNIETLIALKDHGTMMEASTALRISQSAVSKRIAGLENFYGVKLIERQGRRVVLTTQGQELIDKVRPLISELKSVFLEDRSHARGEIIVGVSDAILASWGPRLFAAVQEDLPNLQLTFHAHRSPVVLDRLRSGEYLVGVCTGYSENDMELQSEVIHEESLVIIPSGLKPLKKTNGRYWTGRLPIITIESHSGAWRSISNDLDRLQLTRTISLESFFAVAQMAIGGFGHGLVPVGVARTLGVREELLIDMGRRGLVRPVRFVARKSTFSRPLVREFYQQLLNIIDTVPEVVSGFPAHAHGRR